MLEPAIELRDLTKGFRVRAPANGLRGAVRQLVRARHYEMAALRGLSFSVAAGERVAFVGPNGAGKSTTIKILSGIMRPTSGQARVLGRVPWDERTALGYEIAAVFGQRSRLWTHLAPSDTFNLLARVYGLEDVAYRHRLGELVDALGLAPFMERPVRQLSLGERMRCELAASLLHTPRVLFLDEPTIGLDVVAKATLRELVRERAERDGCTIVLTSHDTGDMERVCDRVLVLNDGDLLLDRPVASLRRDYIRRKVVTLVTEEEHAPAVYEGVEVLLQEPHRLVLRMDTSRTKVDSVVQAALASSRVLDLTVEDPPLDEIIQAIYGSASTVAAGATR